MIEVNKINSWYIRYIITFASLNKKIAPFITVVKKHDIDIDNCLLNCNIDLGIEKFDIPLQYNMSTNWVHNNVDEVFNDRLEASGIDISDICLKIEQRIIPIQ